MLGLHVLGHPTRWPLRLMKRSAADLGTCASSTEMITKRKRLSDVLSPERSHSRSHAPHPSCRSQMGGNDASTSGRPTATSTRNSKPSATPPASQMDKDGLWLIVGLGNPGSNYDLTRHNVGFMVIDALARSEGIECRKLEKSAAVGRGEIGGQAVLLVKPVTFMNNSGESVASLAKFYKVPASRILVISDDLDQPTAGIKLKPKGGHGGHNGIRSIIERMGNTQDFPRIKIGIGRPLGEFPISAYVLQDFSKKEREVIDVAVEESADIVKSVLAVGLEKALSGVRA